ncbi:helix-turn-helix domain-containing protein [Planctomycetota bacterium]
MIRPQKRRRAKPVTLSKPPNEEAFAKFPLHLMGTTILEGTHFKLFCLVASFRNEPAGMCMSSKLIAHFLKMHPDSISRYLGDLEKAGFIWRRGARHSRTRAFFLTDRGHALCRGQDDFAAEAAENTAASLTTCHQTEQAGQTDGISSDMSDCMSSDTYNRKQLKSNSSSPCGDSGLAEPPNDNQDMPASNEELVAAFEQCYRVYPLRQDRLQCLKAFCKKFRGISRHDLALLVEKIVTHITWSKQYDPRWQNPQYYLTFSTYIKNDRYNDERPDDPGGDAMGPAPVDVSDIDFSAADKLDPEFEDLT